MVRIGRARATRAALPRCRRSPYDGETGTALVEFALVLPLLLVVLLGMVDFGKAINYWLDETHLAHTGARWAVVNRYPGPGSLQEYVHGQADTAELRSLASVCVEFPTNPATGTNGQVGDPVRVTMSAPYELLPFISTSLGIDAEVTIRAASTMRLEARPTKYSDGCWSPPSAP